MTDNAQGPCSEDDIIKEGDNIVLDINGEKYSFIKVAANGNLRVGKNNCSIKPIIGMPYGTTFLLNEGGALRPTDEIVTEGMETATTTDRSNAELVAGDNQQLSQADISEMRRQKRGDEIVEALAAASNTFASKTEFSQEKWLKKKTKKYVVYVTALRPTARIICEAYFSKGAGKIFNLRPDSLAIMLSLANVGAFGNVLCIDATGGVLAAACVERMGGHGSLCCAHAEERMYPLDAVRQLNSNRAVAVSTRHCLLSSLLATHAAEADSEKQPEAAPHGGDEGAQPSTAETKQRDAAPSVADKPLDRSEPEGQEAAASLQGGAGGDAQPDGELRKDGKDGADAENAAEGAAAMEIDEPKAAGKNSVAASTLQGTQVGGDAAGAQTKGVPVGAAEDVNGEAGNAGNSVDASVEGEKRSGQEGGGNAPQQGSRRFNLYEDPGGVIPSRMMPATEQDVCTFVRQGFSSLIVVAPRVDPSELVKAVLPMMNPSAAFAVFSSSLQPLTEAFSSLQASRSFISLQLQESWWREHQVLPARTHPTMSTSGTGGYILSGVCIVPSDETREDGGPAGKKRRQNNGQGGAQKRRRQ